MSFKVLSAHCRESYLTETQPVNEKLSRKASKAETMREGARPSGETTSSVANSGGRSAGGDGHGRGRGAAAAGARVPLRRLFAFADWADAALMAVGAAAAAANGMAKPLMTFVVGDVIHAFGSAGANSSRRHGGDDDVVARVTKVRCAYVACPLLASLPSRQSIVPSRPPRLPIKPALNKKYHPCHIC